MLLLIVVTALEWQILWNDSAVGGRAPLGTVGSCWCDLGARV